LVTLPRADSCTAGYSLGGVRFAPKADIARRHWHARFVPKADCRGPVFLRDVVVSVLDSEAGVCVIALINLLPHQGRFGHFAIDRPRLLRSS
jgi:hypothetical protein